MNTELVAFYLETIAIQLFQIFPSFLLRSFFVTVTVGVFSIFSLNVLEDGDGHEVNDLRSCWDLNRSI
jgi:hypothetical protein